MLQHPTPNLKQAPNNSQPSFHIQPYHPDAIPDILKLMQQTLGHAAATRKTEDFWAWKHQANPFGSSYGLYGWGEVQQKVVGLRMLMCWEFQTLAGHLLRAKRAVDTATHPAYQRQGIFSTLTRQAVEDLMKEGVHLVFNTPNQRSLPGYLKLGWQVVTKWPVFIRVLKPLRMLSRRFQLGPSSLPPGQFAAYFGPGIVPWSNFIEQYGPVLPEFVANWEEQRHQVGCRTPRSLEYLQWRYGQHPHLTYGVYVLENSASLAGFAILRPNLRYGWQEIVLTEIFLSEPTLEQGCLLLKNLNKQLKGDYVVAHFAEWTIEKTLLQQAGFVRIPGRGITFTVRPLNELPQSLSVPASWDLTLGDLEIF